MIEVKRVKFRNDTWFQIMSGPEELRGVLIDERLLLKFITMGVEVSDYDAIRLEQSRWN